jgi:hypothetical protein
MRCQEFELIAAEMARKTLRDAATFERANLHAAACDACARRLTDERALTKILRDAAKADERVSAPPQIEANLRAAFRAMHTQTGRANAATPIPAAKDSTAQAATAQFSNAQSSKAAQTSNVLPFVSHQKRANIRARLAIGGASVGLLAACLALVLFAAPRLATRDGSKESSTTPNLSPTMQTSVLPASAARRAADVPFSEASDAPFAAMKELMREPVAKLSVVKTNAMNVKRAARARQAAHRFDSSAAARRDATNLAANDADEIATDFIALTPTTPDMLEGGQIVRLQVSPRALAVFGLLVDETRADEKLKADVILSADGVARAIRFVR